MYAKFAVMQNTLLRGILTLTLLLAPGVGVSMARAQSNAGSMMIDVRNGDQSGKLLINDNDVAFESLTDGKRSRTWKYAEVREVTKRGRKEMRIRPFKGDRYDFQFPDRGQRDKIYDAIANRVVTARQSNRR